MFMAGRSEETEGKRKKEKRRATMVGGETLDFKPFRLISRLTQPRVRD
jgi:hypothetical protein